MIISRKHNNPVIFMIIKRDFATGFGIPWNCQHCPLSIPFLSAAIPLPEDILHSVYSEWLRWKDLSMLDIACVKKNERGESLSSLSDLRILRTLRKVPNSKLRIFYEWLMCRRVFCVEDFPIRLDVIEDLVTVLDMESYCPLLRSIEITRWSINEYYSYNSQGVTVWMSNFDSDIVLSVLIEQLRENSLVKISLQNVETYNEIVVRISSLLTKHASSLRELNISPVYEVDVDFIVSTLIENQICLREWTIYLRGGPSQAMPSLISYLSSSGGLLEVLVAFSIKRPFNAEDVVVSVATFCPQLTRLATFGCKPCSIETLRRLYEQCPHLQDVTIDGVIETNEKRKSVSIVVKGHNEDWAICLSHALRNGQYKNVTLWLSEDYNHRVRTSDLKSMLEPYHIDLDVSITSGTSLISLLQDLPHLNGLNLIDAMSNQFTDATWSAISEHGKSLRELCLIDNFHFSDKQLSELIKACQLLKRLITYVYGWESLEAISKLSNLNMVHLTVAEIVSEETLDGLLLDEKVEWSTALKEGSIRSYRDDFCYNFDNKSRLWVKHGNR
eukprot:scaffold654_cov207-Ochromonas_danica.AAC.25